jgi:hypothetical protein
MFLSSPCQSYQPTLTWSCFLLSHANNSLTSKIFQLLPPFKPHARPTLPAEKSPLQHSSNQFPKFWSSQDELPLTTKTQPINLHARRPKSMLPIVLILYQTTINNLSSLTTSNHQKQNQIKHFQVQISLFVFLSHMGVFESELGARFLGCSRALQ